VFLLCFYCTLLRNPTLYERLIVNSFLQLHYLVLSNIWFKFILGKLIIEFSPEKSPEISQLGGLFVPYHIIKDERIGARRASGQQ